MQSDTEPRRRPGRPPRPDGRDPSFSVRVPLDLRQRVDAIAAERGETRTAAIIWGLRRYVEEFGDDGGH